MNQPTIFLIAVAVSLLGACSQAPSKSNSDPNNANNVNNANNANNTTASNNVVPPGACAGASPIPDGAMTCRTSADCEDPNLSCLYEGEVADAPPNNALVPACDCFAVNECASDEECGDGMLCREFAHMPECCFDVYDTRCDVACEPGTCEAGRRCEEDGHCRDIPCDEGYDCPATFVCDPTADNVDVHGCRLGTCDGDGIDCPTDYECDPSSQFKDQRNCGPIRCDDGYDCADNYDCDTTAPRHGCVLRQCSTDDDCDCGACVNGACQLRIFYCAQQFPQPG